MLRWAVSPRPHAAPSPVLGTPWKLGRPVYSACQDLNVWLGERLGLGAQNQGDTFPSGPGSTALISVMSLDGIIHPRFLPCGERGGRGCPGPAAEHQLHGPQVHTASLPDAGWERHCHLSSPSPGRSGTQWPGPASWGPNTADPQCTR